MSKIVYPLRFDERTFEAMQQKARAEGEVVAVIIRQYVRAGLERDGYYAPPGPPAKADVGHEQPVA